VLLSFSTFIFFALFVIFPSGFGCINVVLLTLLGATRQQDHQPFAVFSKINPVTGTKINAIFGYPRKGGQFKVKPCGLSLLTWMAILCNDIRVL
jgi:hypothetical protein